MKKSGLLGMVLLLLFTCTPASFAADALLSWNRNAEPTVTGYKVYYGAAPRQYTASVDVGNQITYTVTGLSSQLYYFAVTAYDSLGRESDFSNEVSKNLSSTSDTLPPLITGITAGNIATISAKISWSTDEPSNSQVQYGLTTAYGSSTALDTALVTSHSQTITTLLPATLYHYRVLSRDAAGNLSTSSDNTFITAILPDTTAPSLPTNLTAVPVSSSQIDLTWSASTDNVGVAGYRIYRAGVQIGTSGSASYSDKAVTPSTTYSYSVAAYDAAGNVSALSISASATALPPGATTTVVLRPLADTFLNVDSSVNAALQTLNVYTWPANKIANAILMKFDLTAIPKGATIQIATLNLALVESDTTADTGYTTTAHKIINRNPDLTRATGLTYDGVNAWTASACCYNQIPMAQGDISAPYDTKAIDKSLGYKTWNLTALINEWVNQGVPNQGLLINSDPTKVADRYRFFASSEHADTTLRPYLSVTYQLPNTSSDTTPPISQLKAPASGSTVKGSVTVQADLSDNVAVVSVSFFVDGVKQTTQQGTDLKSVTWSWGTAGLPDGAHRLFVQAADAAGLTGNSQEILVTVDNSPPSIPGTPTATSILQDRVTLSWAPSTDSLSAISYRITRDGTALSANPTAVSFTDLGLVPNRTYVYTVTAVDGAGNTSTTSPQISVKTLPLAPVVTTPAASAVASTSATLSGLVDPSGASTSAWFEYGTTTAYGSSTTPVTVTAATTVTASLTGLLPNTLYHFRAVAQNAGGTTRSADQTFTMAPPSDTTPPTAALSKPVSRAYLLETVSVEATVSDNVGVVQVDFLVDGVSQASLKGSAMQSAAWPWDTSLFPEGTHRLQARAYDAAGLIGNSPEVVITIDRTPPAVRFQSPLDKSALRGTVSIKGEMSDNVGVVQADLLIDGVLRARQQGTSVQTVSWQWNSATYTDGTHRLRLEATNAAGLLTAIEISVTVDNTPPNAPGAPAAAEVLQDQISLTWPPSVDAISIMGYGILRDGVALTTTTTPSFVDKGLTPNRSYTYTVVSADSAGNMSIASPALTVKTLPLAPVLTTAAASAVASTSATLSGSVDPSGVSTSAWFEYGATTAYGSSTTPVTVTASTTVSASLTSLLPNTLYHFRIVAQNAGGTARSADQTFTTTVPPDTTPPIAQLKAPASGSTIKGSVTVQADLSDNVAVVSVSFFVDGVKQTTQQGVDLESVSWSWNTAGLSDGAHRLYAQAADAAGLTGNSQEISVTVDNSPPAVPGTPTATSILQDRVTLSWTPSTDSVSSVSYRITRDGTALSAAPTTTTFTDSGLAPNRSYAYTISAVDAAGNSSAASPALTVKTFPLAPVAGTATPTSITTTSATLSGSVDPSGSSTAAWFEYGTTTAYGAITTSVNVTAATTITTPIASLLPATLYHFRIVAQNVGGKSYGPDQTFTTLTDIVLPPPDLGYTLTTDSYKWLATPNPLSLIGDDNFKAVTLPFSFSFYGQTYQQIYIATNGILTFGDGTYAYNRQLIPTPDGPNAYIAPFWRDLYVSAGQISYASSSSEFVVTYTNVRNVCCTLPVFTFQVVLRADGTILLQYDTISAMPETTIGIENQDGTKGIAVPSVAPGQAYKFTPIRP